jgi:hypothetical protein
MRQEAEHTFGYKPKPGEDKVAPTGHLNYDIQDDLNEVMSGNAKGPKGGLGAFAYKPGAPKPFKATRPKQPSLGNPLADTLAERLARGRAIVSRGIVDRDTKRDLMKNGGWKGPKLINGKPIVDVNKLTHDPPELQPTLATKVGQLGTSSIIGNPFPHGFKNVGDLTYLAGGARTYGTGLAYIAKGVPQKTLDRMKMAGVEMPDYMREGIPVLSKLTKPTAMMMAHMEKSWRAALFEHYDRVAPASNDLLKADWIRQDLGDYRNVSAFVRGLQAFGASFPTFGVATVIPAVGRAALKNPQRVENLVRPEVDVNTDKQLGGRSPSEAVSGGPAEDAAKAAFNPAGFWLTSSRGGPIGEAGGFMVNLAQGKAPSLEGEAAKLADEYIPGSALIRDVAQTYAATGAPGSKGARNFADAAYGPPPGASPLLEAIYAYYGGYFKALPSDMKEERDIRHIENPR